MNIDEFIEHAKEKAREHRYHADFFESDNPMNKACIKSAEDCEQLAEWLEKSKYYEDLEEQGLLLRLPVPIGTTVYKFEPLAKGTERYIKTTITRYEVFDDSIWFTFANGLGRNVEDFGKYVFLTQEESDQKLKEMEGGHDRK